MRKLSNDANSKTDKLNALKERLTAVFTNRTSGLGVT